MTSGHPEASAESDGGAFGPQDVAVMRASFNRARNALPPKRRTAANMDAMAVAIVDVAKHGERDLVRLSGHALKAITHGTTNGIV